MLTFGVGFLGDQPAEERDSELSKKAYVIWRNMLQRCYRDGGKNSHRYKDRGVIVCKEWHNYSNFYKWYSEQPFCEDKYHVDKDILEAGNKEYSPEGCLLIPRKLNIFLRGKSKNKKLPLGVSLSRSGLKYQSWATRSDGSSQFLGSFDNEEEAYAVYLLDKHIRLTSLIELLKSEGKVCDKTYYAVLALDLKDFYDKNS